MMAVETIWKLQTVRASDCHISYLNVVGQPVALWVGVLHSEQHWRGERYRYVYISQNATTMVLFFLWLGEEGGIWNTNCPHLVMQKSIVHEYSNIKPWARHWFTLASH